MSKSASPKPADIHAALARLPVLRNRRPDTPESEAGSAFAMLAESRHGGVFVGTFEGESPWERHPNGDELVQILAGETRLTILVAGASTTLDMKSGMLVIVPQGCWHKFHAPDRVTVLTMTPDPTDHSAAEHPT